MTSSMLVPSLVTVEVAPGTRMLVVSDLALAWRPTDTSLAIAAELATVLDTWVGPGSQYGDGWLLRGYTKYQEAQRIPDGSSMPTLGWLRR